MLLSLSLKRARMHVWAPDTRLLADGTVNAQYCAQKACEIFTNLHVHFVRAISRVVRELLSRDTQVAVSSAKH